MEFVGWHEIHCENCGEMHRIISDRARFCPDCGGQAIVLAPLESSAKYEDDCQIPFPTFM